MKNSVKMKFSEDKLYRNVIAIIVGILPIVFIVISGCSKDNNGDPVGPEEPAVVISDDLYIIDPNIFIGSPIVMLSFLYCYFLR